MPNNLDMGGFGSPGLPVRAGLNGAVRVDSSATSSAFEVAVNGSVKAAVTRAGALEVSTIGTSFGTGPTQIWAGGANLGIGGNGQNTAFFGVWCIHADSRASIGWSSGNATSTVNTAFYQDAAAVINQRNGTTAQTFRVTRSYTDASNFSWLTHKWNTTTAVIHAEGLGTGSDGSVAFNDAALATGATVGFVMIPSCAGTPTGVPANIPTGQIPMVWDSTNLKLYAYTGGAWKASAAFT